MAHYYSANCEKSQSLSENHIVAFSRLLTFLLIISLMVASGCGICKKPKRGMIFRGDWAFEVNRTPWIGCPPDTGCVGKSCDKSDSAASECSEEHVGLKERGGKNLLSILKRGENKDDSEKRHGFRVSCGKRKGCRAESPCKMSPVCGTFFDMDNPNPIILAMMRSGQISIPMDVPGMMEMVVAGGNQNATAQGISPPQNSAMNPLVMQQQIAATAQQALAMPGTVLPAGGTLPAGGVTIAGGMVMRPCGMYPQCTPMTPCRTNPQCGTCIPANMAQPNALMLANTTVPTNNMAQAANGMINPAMGQIVQGLTMSGYPQTGYPPIGYTTSGYSPGFPQVNEQPTVAQETGDQLERVAMPSPRFHSVPTKPTFQRSQGLTSAATKADTPKTDAAEKDNAAIQQAYIQQAYMRGMRAGMEQQPNVAAPSLAGVMGNAVGAIASTPAVLRGLMSDNPVTQVSHQQVSAVVPNPAAKTVAVKNTAVQNAATQNATTQNESEDSEPPQPAKKSAPTPKLIQQVSYLDVH